MKIFIIPAIIKPKRPKSKIPIPETFAIVLNSLFDGFFSANHTLLHFNINDVNPMF